MLVEDQALALRFCLHYCVNDRHGRLPYRPAGVILIVDLFLVHHFEFRTPGIEVFLFTVHHLIHPSQLIRVMLQQLSGSLEQAWDELTYRLWARQYHHLQGFQ